MQRRPLLDVVVGERAVVLELLPREDQRLLVGRDARLDLDLPLHGLDGLRRLDVERRRLTYRDDPAQRRHARALSQLFSKEPRPPRETRSGGRETAQPRAGQRLDEDLYTFAHHEVQRRLLLDGVVGERSGVLEFFLRGDGDEALLVGPDARLVRDLLLQGPNGIRRLDVKPHRRTYAANTRGLSPNISTSEIKKVPKEALALPRAVHRLHKNLRGLTHR